MQGRRASDMVRPPDSQAKGQLPTLEEGEAGTPWRDAVTDEVERQATCDQPVGKRRIDDGGLRDDEGISRNGRRLAGQRRAHRRDSIAPADEAGRGDRPAADLGEALAQRAIGGAVEEATGDKSRPRTRIIAMTAAAMDEEKDRCIEAGMDDFVSKPVNLERLGACLGQMAKLPSKA